MQVHEYTPLLNHTDNIHWRDHYSEGTYLQYHLAACYLPVSQ